MDRAIVERSVGGHFDSTVIPLYAGAMERI